MLSSSQSSSLPIALSMTGSNPDQHSNSINGNTNSNRSSISNSSSNGSITNNSSNTNNRRSVGSNQSDAAEKRISMLRDEIGKFTCDFIRTKVKHFLFC